MPYVVFALLAAASWNRWIEPYVDSGRELMVPWRVAQGERLYRDVQFPHGPLAPWLGAACDLVFGRSLPARTALAGGIALLALAALERLARGFLSPGRAALATSLAVAAAFFLRPGGWMFPFSFDCAIAVGALTWALVASVAPRRGGPADGLAGFCLLAALLARVEMGLAGVAILVVHVLVTRRPLRLLRLAFFPLVSAAIVYGAASYGIPFERLVADGWLVVIRPPEAFQHVYRAYAGLDALGLRLAELGLAAAVLALIAAWLCAAAVASGFVARRSPRAAGAARAVEVAGWIPLAALAVLALRPPASLAETLALVPPLVRVVPPIVVAAAAWRLALRLLRREPSGPFAAVPDAVLWLSALFAARVFLAAGYAGPYGAFFLPLPLVICVAGLFAAGDRLSLRIGPALPRLIALALAVFLASRAAAVALVHRESPGESGWSEVRTPAGALWLREPEASTTRAVLDALAPLADPAGRSRRGDATLAGFPEGGFFAYVLGFRNPFWLEQFFPGRLDAAGEERAIALLRSRPPEILVYANVLAVGEGQRAFGTDYLRRLDAAAREVSTTVAIYGPGARPDARIGDPDFFVELRRPSRAEVNRP